MSVETEARRPLAVPPIVERATWSEHIDGLRRWERAHMRAGDALAAARRRLPMTEVDGTIPLTGPHGAVPLLDVFEGRRQLAVYFHMWHDGAPAAEQCSGCTFFTDQRGDNGHLHSRDVTFAVFCQGPHAESARYRDFMGWTMPWYSVRGPWGETSAEDLLEGRTFALFVCYLRDGDRVFETYWTQWRGFEQMASDYGLLDLTPYGRQEGWEDSPDGWPAPFENIDGTQFATAGRPTSQWARLAAGRDDGLHPRSS